MCPSPRPAKPALGMVGELRPALVISDVRMPGMDGLTLLDELRTRGCGADVDSHDGVRRHAHRRRRRCAAAPSSFSSSRSISTSCVESVDPRRSRTARVRKRGVARRRRATRRRVGRRWSAATPQMIAVYKLRRPGGRTSGATVLIRGESGTGKELVARAIHDLLRARRASRSCRSTAPRCPSTLLESELFGHVRGAFTGAVNNRRGRFAHRRPRHRSSSTRSATRRPSSRASSCGSLQNREFQPVGAGAHRAHGGARRRRDAPADLEQMIAAGTFREDLYYRLRVVDIALPPLRERPRRHSAPRATISSTARARRSDCRRPRCRATRCERSRVTAGRGTCASSRIVSFEAWFSPRAR